MHIRKRQHHQQHKARIRSGLNMQGVHNSGSNQQARTLVREGPEIKGSANRPRRASAKSVTVSHTARITVHTAARPAHAVKAYEIVQVRDGENLQLCMARAQCAQLHKNSVMLADEGKPHQALLLSFCSNIRGPRGPHPHP